MQEGVSAPLVHHLSHSGAKQQLLGDDHAANVLHRAVELRDEDLVVLGEWVVGPEQSGKKVKAAFRNLDYVIGVKVLGEGRSTGQGERNDLTRDGGVRVADYLVLARHHSGEVGRDTRCRRKVPYRGTLGKSLEFGSRLV